MSQLLVAHARMLLALAHLCLHPKWLTCLIQQTGHHCIAAAVGHLPGQLWEAISSWMGRLYTTVMVPAVRCFSIGIAIHGVHRWKLGQLLCHTQMSLISAVDPPVFPGNSLQSIDRLSRWSRTVAVFHAATKTIVVSFAHKNIFVCLL